MENAIPEKNQKKLKFDDSEYFVDSLPDEAKQLITGLRTADSQTKLYEDTLKLIAISKRKMVEDLKKILENIDPIQKSTFGDYNKGIIKSLGSWGGDFILVTGQREDLGYFRDKGYNTIYVLEDLVYLN